MSRKKVKAINARIEVLFGELKIAKKNCRVICRCGARERVGDLIVFKAMRFDIYSGIWNFSKDTEWVCQKCGKVNIVSEKDDHEFYDIVTWSSRKCVEYENSGQGRAVHEKLLNELLKEELEKEELEKNAFK